MSTAARNNQLPAGERAARQERVQRRVRVVIAAGSITAVLAIVISLVLVKALGGSSAARPRPAGVLPASAAAGITSVPAGTLNAVGTGTASPGTVTRATGALLTSGSKPEIVYVGAEYCPYCATERWALAIALSRFGTFSGLHGIYSSSTDVYPSTPTLTFFGSSYASRYFAFTPVETTTENPDIPLQSPTAAQQALLSRYDAPPYVPAGDAGSIPFIDLGNQFLIHGAQYDPQVLQGHTWAQVASALRDPSSAIARDADGAANMITAAMCKLTGNRPAAVCASPVITHIQGQQ